MATKYCYVVTISESFGPDHINYVDRVFGSRSKARKRIRKLAGDNRTSDMIRTEETKDSFSIAYKNGETMKANIARRLLR